MDEIGSLWVYLLRECTGFHEFPKVGIVPYIYVVVGTRHAEKSMVELQVVVTTCFQDNRNLLVFVSMRSSPCFGTILPHDVGTVDVEQVAWNTMNSLVPGGYLDSSVSR